MTKKKVYLGKIIAAHGVKGLLKVEFYNKSVDELKKYINKIHIDNFQINLNKKFTKGKFTICQLDNYNNRDEVASIIGKEFWIDENNLDKNKVNEYFHKDLIDIKVYDKNNQYLGEVCAIHNFGAGDLLELRGKFKFMIRFYDLNIEDIDLESKVIRLSKSYEI